MPWESPVWTCKKCNIMNWTRHTTCYRCWAAQPGAQNSRGSGKGWSSAKSLPPLPPSASEPVQPASVGPQVKEQQAKEQKAQKEQRVVLNSLFSALKALPKDSTNLALVEAKESLQKQIQTVKASMRDSKPVKTRITNTEAFIAKQVLQLEWVEAELAKHAEEKTKLLLVIAERKKHLEQLKEEDAQQAPYSDDEGGGGDEELSELLTIVMASPNKRAKALADSLRKRLEASYVDDSSDEMDDSSGPLCGTSAVGDPYGGVSGTEGGDASWDAPDAAGAAESTGIGKKIAGSAAAGTTFVKQKIDKINRGAPRTVPSPVKGGPLKSFGAPRHFRKPPAVGDLGYVVPGVEVEDY